VIGFTVGRQTGQKLNDLLKATACTIVKARVMRHGKSSAGGLGQRLLEERFDYALIVHRWQAGPEAIGIETYPGSA
jgi:hypothetical protein